MLISSPRHTPADLALWAEYEEADRAYSHMPRLARKVTRSMAVLREFLAAGKSYGGVSHGKDSTVLWHLLYMVGGCDLVHLRPSNHNPDCDLVRDDLLHRWPMAYSEVPIDYGDLHVRRLPDHVLDKLTDERWYAAIRNAGEPYAGRHILGIRADESGGRKIRMLRWGESSPNACAPIGWWTTQDVFSYLALHDLPVHPAYACLGGGRWPRDRLRVAEIGDTHGKGGGRSEWEREYYPTAGCRGGSGQC